jgi:hypothetical protein
MLRAFPGFSAVSPVPTVVMVFATDRSFEPAKPLFRGKRIELAGLFQPGEDVNYVALSAEVIDLALMTIFHEYSHFPTGNSTADLPVWVSEGLAEVYEMLQERDGGSSAVFGLAPAHHVELLKRSTLMPIRELAAVDHQSPVYNEDSRRGVFYAESWALVHYLTLGNTQRAQQFRQYVSSLASGVTPPAAFEGAFGADAALLDRELFEYVRRVSFTAVQVDFADLAQALLAQGEFTRATSYLGPLVARGRGADVRSRARDLLGRVGELRNQARASAGAAATEPGTVPAPEGGIPDSRGLRPHADAAAGPRDVSGRTDGRRKRPSRR